MNYALNRMIVHRKDDVLNGKGHRGRHRVDFEKILLGWLGLAKVSKQIKMPLLGSPRQAGAGSKAWMQFLMLSNSGKRTHWFHWILGPRPWSREDEEAVV